MNCYVSTIDPEMSANVDALVSSVEGVGVLEHGCAGQAVQAQSELDRLLSAPQAWTSLEDLLLGDGHSSPVDLLNLVWARFSTCGADGPWRELIVVIERLRVEAHGSFVEDPDMTPQRRKQWMTYHATIDMFSVVAWSPGMNAGDGGPALEA